MSALTSPVLALNKNYAAIRVTSARRAFSLLFAGAAEVLDVENNKYNTYDFESWQELSELKAEFEPEGYSWINCVSCALMVPTVIRLIQYDRLGRHKVRFNRRNIYARDNNHCQYCGKRFKTSELNLDHVFPKSRGGRSTWENVVCSCLKCNTRKGSRTPHEANMTLIRKPKSPKHVADLIPMRHDSWKHFIDAAYWNVELKD